MNWIWPFVILMMLCCFGMHFFGHGGHRHGRRGDPPPDRAEGQEREYEGEREKELAHGDRH